MNLLEHAEMELKIAGYDISKEGCNPKNPKDPMDGYVNSCAKCAYDLIKTLSKQGHSGMSVGLTLSLFNKLAKYKNLTSLTNNPDEWMKLQGCEDGPWQSKRNPSCFSDDNLKTYSDVDDKSGTKYELEDYKCTSK